MDKTPITGLISSVVAIGAAAIAVWGQLRVKRIEAQLELQKAEAGRRAETLGDFASRSDVLPYELQSRIFNIVRGGFLTLYWKGGDDRTRAYAINHTLFVIAQYFAWTELIRQEIQFIDLGADGETRQLAQLQHKIYSAWQTDKYKPLLRVFGGEQHAIGERMIWEGPRGPQCLGFASFLDYLNRSPDPLIYVLKSDVESLGNGLEEAMPRLTELQHSLIDLAVFLDPGAVRFPKKNRTKLDLKS